MSKKKSYMDRKNILSEGFIQNLFRKFKELRKLNKKQKQNLKVDRKLKGHVKSLNKSVSDVEKYFKQAYGVDVDLDKFDAKDFR